MYADARYIVGPPLKKVSGQCYTRHKITGEITATVNSFHNHALKKCPVDYYVLAYSEDGEIEAIRHLHLPWEGWMWRPERETPFSRMDIERLQVLFK